MENQFFLIALLISIVYFFFRFFEMRFMNKENRPLKELVKDGLLVYISSVAGLYLVDQLGPLSPHGMGGGAVLKEIHPPAFTTPADF